MKHSHRSIPYVRIIAAAFVVGTLVFGLRSVPSFSPFLHAAADRSDLSVPYRYISVGWIDWATVQLKEMTQVSEPDAEILFLLGLAHDSLGEYDAALAAYDEIARIFAHDAAVVGRAKALAGNVNLRLGRFEAARRLLLASDRLQPNQALVTFGLGAIAERDGDLPGALRWFDRSMLASPRWVEPAVRGAAVHLELNDPAAAALLLQPYEVLASRDPEFHLHLAAAYAALADLGVKGGLEQHHIEAFNEAGVAADAVTFAALARHALDRARQLDPEHERLGSLARVIDEISTQGPN